MFKIARDRVGTYTYRKHGINPALFIRASLFTCPSQLGVQRRTKNGAAPRSPTRGSVGSTCRHHSARSPAKFPTKSSFCICPVILDQLLCLQLPNYSATDISSVHLSQTFFLLSRVPIWRESIVLLRGFFREAVSFTLFNIPWATSDQMIGKDLGTAVGNCLLALRYGGFNCTQNIYIRYIGIKKKIGTYYLRPYNCIYVLARPQLVIGECVKNTHQ